MFKGKWFHLLSFSTVIVLVLSTMLISPVSAAGANTDPCADLSQLLANGLGACFPGYFKALPSAPDMSADVSPLLGHRTDFSNIVPMTSGSGSDVWCPSAVSKPTPGLNGCSVAQPNLAALLSYFIANPLTVPNADGAIWLSGGTDSSIYMGVIVVDGFNPNFTSWANHSLVLKSAKPTTFDQTVGIVNWNNSVAFSNINIVGAAGPGIGAENINGYVTFSKVNVNGASEAGVFADHALGASFLQVNVTGVTPGSFSTPAGVYSEYIASIGLSRVNSSGNSTPGAYLVATGTVTLTGKKNTFNNNTIVGLLAESGGSIAVSNLTASGNTGSPGVGAALQAGMSVTGSSLIITGKNTFNSNAYYGIVAVTDYSGGALTASNITANNNLGAAVYGAGLGGNTVAFAKGSFAHNLGYGLAVQAKTSATIAKVKSGYNTNDGLFVYEGTTYVHCSKFYNNSAYGWETGTTGSGVPSISLFGVKTVGNLLGPFHLDNPGTMVTTSSSC